MANLQTKKPKKLEKHKHMEMFQCVPNLDCCQIPMAAPDPSHGNAHKLYCKTCCPFMIEFHHGVSAKLIKTFELFHNVCKLGYQFLAVVRFSVRYHDVNDRLRWPSFQHCPNMKWNITIGTLDLKTLTLELQHPLFLHVFPVDSWPQSSVKPKGNRIHTNPTRPTSLHGRETNLNPRFLACKVVTCPSYLANKRIFRTYCQRQTKPKIHTIKICLQICVWAPLWH